MASYDDTAVVSGSVVSFPNGADDVPTKSLVVTIPPTLSGVSSVTETQTGKNLIDLSSLVDGYVNSNGTFNTNHTQGEMRSDFIPVLPNTVYYFSIVETTGTAEAWVGIGEYTDTNTSSFVKRDGYWRFTTSATTKYVVVSARNLAQATKIQLEIGNDPTTWEEYTPIEQYTASLGRTIYGGTADLVNGEGTEGCSSPIALNGLTWSKTTVSGHDAFYAALPNGYIGEGANPLDGVCSSYIVVPNDSSLATDQTCRFYYNSNFNFSRIIIRDDQYASYTGAQFKEAVTGNIVYELAESARTDYTFTGQEVPTRLGYNAFWSEQGDTELTYYKDGYGFTSVTIHKETPDGEPVEQTAKLHKIVYGGTADVVRGRIEEHYPFYEISSFNGMFGKVNNGYCFYVQIDGTAHTLSDIEPNCMIANQLFTYGTVSRGSAPVWQYGGNDGTAKTHAFILPNDYDTLEKANAFLASLETPLKVTLKKTTPNVFTFPPISMETDEGENTLFANEGASAITYRKETD